MGPIAPLHSTLSDLEKKSQSQGHSEFEGLYMLYVIYGYHKIGHMSLANLNGKPYMGSPIL